MYEKLNEILLKMLNEQTQDSIDISQLTDTDVRKIISMIFVKTKKVEIDIDSDEIMSKIPTKMDKFRTAVIQILLIGMKIKSQKSNIKLPAKVFDVILRTFEIDGKKLFQVINSSKFNSLIPLINITTDITEKSLVKTNQKITEEIIVGDYDITKSMFQDTPTKDETDIKDETDVKDENVEDIQTEDDSVQELDQKLQDSPNYNIISSFWNRIKSKKITLANFESQLNLLSNYKKNTGLPWLIDKEDTTDENVKKIIDNLQTYLIIIFLVYLVNTNNYNFNTFRNIILRYEKESKKKGENMKEQYIKFNKKYVVDESFTINGVEIKSGSIIEVINEDPLLQHQMNMLDFGLNPDNPVFQTDRAKIKPEYISWMIKWMGKVLQEDSDKWLQFFEMVLQMMNIKVVNKADTFSEMLKIIYKNFQEESDRPNQ